MQTPTKSIQQCLFLHVVSSNLVNLQQVRNLIFISNSFIVVLKWIFSKLSAACIFCELLVWDIYPFSVTVVRSFYQEYCRCLQALPECPTSLKISYSQIFSFMLYQVPVMLPTKDGAVGEHKTAVAGLACQIGCQFSEAFDILSDFPIASPVAADFRLLNMNFLTASCYLTDLA